MVIDCKKELDWLGEINTEDLLEFWKKNEASVEMTSFYKEEEVKLLQAIISSAEEWYDTNGEFYPAGENLRQNIKNYKQFKKSMKSLINTITETQMVVETRPVAEMSVVAETTCVIHGTPYCDCDVEPACEATNKCLECGKITDAIYQDHTCMNCWDYLVLTHVDEYGDFK